MNCFIGGSGSTGSSVLANVLNRHSRLFCGPESYLYTKEQLFDDWNTTKVKILDGKIKSFPWHRYSRVDIDHEAFDWDRRKLRELINYSPDIFEFSEEFFGNALRAERKYHWIEKTPSNVYCFRELEQRFPNCYLINTIRNPYDTIASLNRRGFSVYYATSLYLLNTAIGLAMKDYENHIPIVYEEMVTRPKEVISQLCMRLGVKFEQNMLAQSKSSFDEDIDSWRQSESSEISPDSIGGFAELSRLVQEEIITTVNALSISPFYIKKYQIEFPDIPAICEYMNFQHYEDDGFHNIFQMQIDKTRDHFSRIIKGYPSKFSQYPITFRI